MHKRFTRGAVGCAVAIALVATACTGGGPKATDDHASKQPTPAAASRDSTATFALDESLNGFNVDSTAGDEAVLQEVMNTVWPTVFITMPTLKEKLNKDFVTSATSTVSGTTQTVVYTINPKATWSDGTPITADDFIYNWQTQSGNPAYRDLGDKPYDPAGTAGYNTIASVKGSAPSSGRCDRGSAADRNAGLCPNGDTVTVTLSKPDSLWRGALFYDLAPAHVARKVGWDTGFNNWKNTISGSWYQISSYVPNQSVTLTRNPKYWGTPAKLSTIVFRIYPSDQAEAAALTSGEVDVISPTTVDAAIVQQTSDQPGVRTKVLPGLGFEHLDFNEANPYLAKLAVRQAIAYGTDRHQIIARTVGQVDPNIAPLGNHMFVATERPYVDNGSAYDHVDDAKATSLLKGLGYRKVAGYFEPNNGPLTGKPLSFAITTTAGNTERVLTERLFQTQMKKIGIKITIENQAASTFFGASLPQGRYDIAEFAWIADADVATNESIYCSYTDAAHCGGNYTHYANPQVDRLMAEGSLASTPQAEDRDYNQADKLLWNDMVALPLYQKPEYFAWTSTLRNVQPTATELGATWNDEKWSFTPDR
jgi:peptide/nickel transport system substrate-binding protein